MSAGRTDPSVCAECGERPVASGDAATSVAARKLEVCHACYKRPAVKARRRRELGFPAEGPLLRGSGKAKLLPAPAGAKRKPQAKAGALLPVPVIDSPPVDAKTHPLRAQIRAVLLRDYCRAAAAECRTLAEELERAAAQG